MLHQNLICQHYILDISFETKFAVLVLGRSPKVVVMVVMMRPICFVLNVTPLKKYQ